MNRFRALRADEIDCRIAQIKKDGTGLSLLLYKDARCDQNILDETVGEMNWERKHSRDNANCTVSIWDKDKQMWISKEDTGTESNTEKEKGLASDSFKRACFNWGIGRELYTAPFIWIESTKCNIEKKDGKVSCYDRFTVSGIGYTDGVITGLEIKNQKTGKVCFKFGKIQDVAPVKPEQPDTEPEEPKPVKQDAPAEVKTVPKIPEVSPVQKYLNNEIAFMSQRLEISDRKEMRKRFAEMRKGLIDAKIIPDISADQITMEQATDMIEAMYSNFFTDEGVKKWSAS